MWTRKPFEKVLEILYKELGLGSAWMRFIREEDDVDCGLRAISSASM